MQTQRRDLWTQWGKDGLGEQCGNIYITLCEKDSQWGSAVQQREFNLLLCDDLEGWHGVAGGGDICILVIDSC